MVVKLDGNLEIGAHVSDLGYQNCLMHLFRSKAVTNLIYFSEKDPFPFTRAQRALSCILI